MSQFYDNASLVVVPSGYKAGTVYAQKPLTTDGQLAFTRTGDTATRVNSAGLIEKVRTNLALYSEDFTWGGWNKYQATITANSVLAPNGTTTADTITDSAVNDVHIAYQSISFPAGEFSVSCYAKANTLSHAFLQIYNGTNFYASGIFNLTNGTVSGAGSITSVGNGWYRLSFTAQITAGVGFAYVGTSNGSSVSYSGTGQSLYIWGYQAETGVATAYIPTTTAAVSVGPVANVPRLDYLGSTCPRLLLEPQRTNWVPYSERLELGYAFAYVDGLTITQNTTETLDPFGYYGAEKFQTTTGLQRADNYSGAMSGLQQVHSIFAKAGTANTISIECLGGSGYDTQFAATFNIANGTVTSTSGTPTVSGVQSYGNGWYRCYVGGIGSSSFHVKGVLVNGTGSVYMTGWMWEEGNYPTSYIGATLGAAVTRGADACSKTGISSLIGQTEGTVFVEFKRVPKGVNYQAVVTLQGASASYLIEMYFGSANTLTAAVYNAGAQFQAATSALSEGTYKAALAYKENDFAFYVNGVQISTDNSGTVPALSTYNLGDFSYLAGYPQADGINQALLFKTRLTNAELAELTTL